MHELILRKVSDLMKEEIKPRDMVLTPWLPAQGIAMVAGERGVGKTMFGLGCAMAIASGGEILGWQAPKPRRVLYVDGEMALVDMKQRLHDLQKGHPNLSTAGIFLCSHQDQPKGIPNLIENPKVRRDIERSMADMELEVLILDNLSCLCNSADENSAESWTIMQEWMIRLRAKGYTVVFLHHTGKPDKDSGKTVQRGTSKREDVLDSYLKLAKDKGQDTGFQVWFEKHRGFEPQHDLHGRLDFTPGCCTLRTVEEKRVAAGKKPLDVKRFEKDLQN